LACSLKLYCTKLGGHGQIGGHVVQQSAVLVPAALTGFLSLPTVIAAVISTKRMITMRATFQLILKLHDA